MPSPRPLGSGVRKILVLPHGLQYQVLHFIAFPSYSSEPCIGSFEGGCLCGFLLRGPGLCLLFLWAVAADVSHLTTIIALHLGQASLVHLLLALMVPFTWFEGWFGRVIDAQSSIFLTASAFHLSLVGIVMQNVFCIRQSCSSSVDIHSVGITLRRLHVLSGCERVVKAWGYPFDLFLSIFKVNVLALSTNCGRADAFHCSYVPGRSRCMQSL